MWSPLAQGVLTGKYLPDISAAWLSCRKPDNGLMFDKAFLSASRAPSRAADQTVSPSSRTDVRRIRPGSCCATQVASAIIGATGVEQIDENVTASGTAVDPALFAEAERLVECAVGAVA